MKGILVITALALATGCAASPEVSRTASSAASRVKAQPAAAVEEDDALDLNAMQQISVEIADHLEEAQPGELGMSLTPTATPEPKREEPRRAAARPKLVSKRSRAQLFVLPTRHQD